MEMNYIGAKIEALRKEKKITQETLGKAVGLTPSAISNIERNRSTPSVETLGGLAEYFGVSVDELLSGEELLTIAEADTQKREDHLRDIVFGLLDISAAMFLFLPFFGQKVDGNIREVSLLALTGISLYLKIVYFAVVASMVTTGILTLSMQNWEKTFWVRCKAKLSCGINATGALLFIVSLQPYAAAFLFLFLVIKVLMVIKWR